VKIFGIMRDRVTEHFTALPSEVVRDLYRELRVCVRTVKIPLLCIREVLTSNIGQETGYPD
jgi:hypothetical protein